MSTTTTTTTTTGQAITATVTKYNPSKDSAPYTNTYQVPWRPFMSVLELLRYIHENIEPISFEYSCRTAVCGQCGLEVNGKPVLPCVTMVQPGAIKIEPLAGFPVIKDLVVDKSAVTNRLYGTRPWWSRATEMTQPVAVAPSSYVKVAVASTCKECLLCQSICPVLTPGNPDYKGFQAFGGPFILIRLAMRYYDPREGLADERLKTAVREGLFNCILCGKCDQVCPMSTLVQTPGQANSSINLVQTFEAMMQDAEDKGYGGAT